MEKSVVMSTRNEAAGAARSAGLRGLLGRLRGDRRGVAAVEFALIVPLLLCMYLITMEASQAIETNKKVSRVASLVADLVAQQQTVSVTDVGAIMRIGEALLQPYNRSTPQIYVTAIELSNETPPKVKVSWSLRLDGNNAVKYLSKGDNATVPNSLKVPGSFLIQVTSDLGYKPVITYSASEAQALGLTSAFNNISMSETYYLRPRMSSQVTCTNCP